MVLRGIEFCNNCKNLINIIELNGDRFKMCRECGMLEVCESGTLEEMSLEEIKKILEYEYGDELKKSKKEIEKGEIGKGEIIEYKYDEQTEMYISKIGLKSYHKSFIDNIEDGDMIRISRNRPSPIENLEGGEFGIVKWYSEDVIWLMSPNKVSERKVYMVRATPFFLLKIQKELLDEFEKNGNQFWKDVIFKKSQNLQNNKSTKFSFDTFHFPLNKSQKEACQNSISLLEKDGPSFWLIHGPPGTGKTTTITEILLQAKKMGKKVILTSHTNTAIDNALEKLIEIGGEKDIVRIGKLKVSEKLRKVSREINFLSELILNERKSIIGTTLSKLHILTWLEKELKNKKPHPIADLIIIDEASMASIPLVLICFYLAEKIILVGDHHQLRPISKRGKVKSLFELLISKYPEASTLLDTQYRANKKIIEFSNRMFYHNKISSGEENENICLEISCKLSYPFSEILDKEPLIWVDTKKFSEHEWKERRSKEFSAYNVYELAVIKILIDKLINCGIKSSEIGIISPFKTQSSYIRRYLQKSTTHAKENIEVLDTQIIGAKTVDAFQGREKDIIIFNLVLSPKGKECIKSTILNDYRRLNVALTRAKRKLIIVGSSELTTVEKYILIKKLYEFFSKEGKVVELQEKFHKEYEEIYNFIKEKER